MIKNVLFSLTLLLLSSCSVYGSGNLKSRTILKKVKRNELYYTQGIFFDTDNTVIESGGLYGESVLVRMEFPSMKIIKKVNLDGKYFAEGIAKCGDYIYQLTWQNRKILKYSYPNLELVDTLDLDKPIHEGWGLASDGTVLYATDGSNNIYTLDCNTLKVKKTVSVFHNGNPLDSLNAIAIVDGKIYANKYYDNRIFKINPENGKILDVFDMKNLVDKEYAENTLTPQKMLNGYVLNGIAFRTKDKNFLVTGKKWGHYYEVNLK